MRFTQFSIPDELAALGYDMISIYGEPVFDDRYSLGQLTFSNIDFSSPDYLAYISGVRSVKLLPK